MRRKLPPATCAQVIHGSDPTTVSPGEKSRWADAVTTATASLSGVSPTPMAGPKVVDLPVPSLELRPAFRPNMLARTRTWPSSSAVFGTPSTTSKSSGLGDALGADFRTTRRGGRQGAV